MRIYSNKYVLTCACCGNSFSAKKSTAQFCSSTCTAIVYKEKMHLKRLANTKPASQPVRGKGKVHTPALRPYGHDVCAPSMVKELVNISQLSEMITISVRTLSRLMQDPAFPIIQIGRNVRFHPATVVNHLQTHYKRKPSCKPGRKRRR
jgi:predicted DNA-binding transcriptional regulator AlpA